MSTRPPRPSPEHWYDRENKRWVHPSTLSWLREKQLQDDPYFKDIEREGHTDLTGPRSSVSLRAVMNERDIATGRGFDESIDQDDELLQYSDSYRARYYHYAALLSAEAVKNAESPIHTYIYQCHAEGISQRSIRDLLENDMDVYWTRKRVRTVVEAFAEKVKAQIDFEAFEGI